jgi:hypothetical protein
MEEKIILKKIESNMDFFLVKNKNHNLTISYNLKKNKIKQSVHNNFARILASFER